MFYILTKLVLPQLIKKTPLNSPVASAMIAIKVIVGKASLIDERHKRPDSKVVK